MLLATLLFSAVLAPMASGQIDAWNLTLPGLRANSALLTDASSFV